MMMVYHIIVLNVIINAAFAHKIHLIVKCAKEIEVKVKERFKSLFVHVWMENMMINIQLIVKVYII